MGTTSDERPRQRQPRFWIILLASATVVGAGYEAIAAWTGDGSFDIDYAIRIALIAMVSSLIASWGVRDGHD